MRLRILLLVAAGVILVIMLGAVLALRSLDFNTYKGLIAERAKAMTGRDLRIGGSLALEIGFSPAVVAEDVSFGNASWGSRPELLKVRRIEVEVALLPLIFRDIRVKRLILVQPDILLETDANGIGNWSLGGSAPSAAPATKPGKTTMSLAALTAEKVRIEKGIIIYRDGRTKRATALAVDRLDLRAKDAGSPLTIDLAAAYDGKAFTLAGTVGPLGEVTAPTRPYPVKLALRANGATLEMDGTVGRPMEAAALDLKASAKGQELAEVVKLAGRKVPALGPFAVTGQVTGSMQALSVSGIDASLGKAEQVLVKATGAVKDALNARGISVAVAVESKDLRSAAKAFGADLPPIPPLRVAARIRDVQGAYAFDDLRANIGKSGLAGSGVVAIGGPRPRLQAQLASALLDLTELLPLEKKATAGGTPSQKIPGPGQEKRVIPADPLPRSVLQAADADLDLTVDKLVLPNKLSVEALAMHLTLASGRLEVQPLSSRIGGGTLTGSLGLDTSMGKAALLTAKTDARAIDLGQVLRQMGNPDLVRGVRTDLSLNVRGSGGSVRELMAGLNGDLLLVLGEGKIDSKFVEWLGADLLTQIVEKVNPFGKPDPYTELKCGVIRFTARDGIASTDRGVAFETGKMTVVSSGTVSFKSEAIDLSVRPDTRQMLGIGAGELLKLMRIRGTLAEPKFTLDELQAAKSVASIGAAVATSGFSFLAESLIKRVMADSRPCETAMARTPAPTKTGAAPPAAASTGQPAPRQGGEVQQLLRGLFGR